MQLQTGVVIACLSVITLCMEGEFSRKRGMLTASQMRKTYPQFPKGLPFIWHFGMWGDLFIITPIVGFIVAFYSDQWSLEQILIMYCIGMTLSALMHVLYVKAPFPDSLAWEKEGLTAAGYMHVFYMGFAFAIIGLLYFCTSNVSPKFAVAVSAVLVVHVAIGNHIVLGFINEYKRFAWCPEFLRKPDPWITIAATGVILAGLTAWATTAQAGFTVLALLVVFELCCVGAVYPLMKKKLENPSDRALRAIQEALNAPPE